MQEIKNTIAAACKELFDIAIAPELTPPDKQFGDYATNVALQLSKQLAKNPREIAEAIVQHVKGLNSHIKEVAVAVPGFINITLTDEALWQLARAPSLPKTYASQQIVIETNNPNPFKDMHIGHAYNSIIGDTLAELLEAGGGDVHRVSYHGDVGIHVGKSMWAILKYIDQKPEKLNEIAEADRPDFMSRMYREGNAAYEEDASAKPEIEQLASMSFSLKDPVYKEIYETCNSWSFAYFDSIFTLIGSKPIERRYLEREADAIGRKTVETHIGTLFEKSDGAVIFPGEKHGTGLHTVVLITQRDNTLYSARDLGLLQLKSQDYHPDGSYIVTAVEQKDYFKTILKAAELALPNLSVNTTNISTGTVKLASGKMSSRKGTFINIGWLIDEISKALIARGGNAAATKGAIIGALRYAMLKVRIGSDVIYDINEAVSLQGNSGSYLQYAHARACSILKKSEVRGEKLDDIRLEVGERSLVRKIGEYNEVVSKAVGELMPHHICGYLYELSQTFNSFYEHHRVIGDPRQDIRLQLVKIYANTLKNGLNLLNITAPEKM